MSDVEELVMKRLALYDIILYNLNYNVRWSNEDRLFHKVWLENKGNLNKVRAYLKETPETIREKAYRLQLLLTLEELGTNGTDTYPTRPQRKKELRYVVRRSAKRAIFRTGF